MKLIPIKDIDEQDEFFGGARFVKKYTGLRGIKSEEDFFEYMLFNDNSSSDWMPFAHIDRYEAGSVVSQVKTTIAETGRKTVTAKEIIRSNILNEELDNWFYRYEDFDRYWIQNQKTLIDRLNLIDFHDLPVSRLSFNLDYMILSISFELYNEKTSEYDSLTIDFENIQNLETDKLLFDSDTDIEITGFDYKYSELFEGKLLLLTGHGKPSLEIEFKCEKLKLK
jgi:hypothetical protein